jgi:hypothetical protein
MTKTTTPSSRLPRFRRAPKAAPGIRLTDRDRALLYDLFHYRVLPTSLIVERQFGSMTRGRNRLKLLYHHGYVDRTFRPSVGPATSEAVYSLGPSAVAELATFYGLEPGAIRRRRTNGRIDPHFLEHRLLVARFRIRLAASGAPLGVGIHDWREDGEAELSGRVGREHFRVAPDGMAWVKSKHARFAFCLEADRGTMTVGRVKTKFERYLAAGRAGSMQTSFGAARFRVLVVAPTEARLASLKAGAESVRARNVWLAAEPDLEQNLVTGAVWRRAGKSEGFPLLKREQIEGTPERST